MDAGGPDCSHHDGPLLFHRDRQFSEMAPGQHDRDWWICRHRASQTGTDVFVQAVSSLRKEILGWLYLLTSRHEREGRHVPKSEDIVQMLTRTDEHGQPLVSGLPGPLEGHRRPTAPVPQEVTEKMGDSRTAGTEPSVLYWLATLSQFFALDEAELERAREAVKAMGDTNYSTEPSENLKLLGSASIVAAANRNTPLADEILDALVRIVPRLSTEEEISRIPQIMLQAAAVV